MEQKQFQCTGNCLSCPPAQRSYCASQHAYSNMKVLDKLMGMALTLQVEVRTLSEKIEAIQDNEALVFNPEEKSEIPTLSDGTSKIPADHNTAQKGSGA